LNASCSDNTWKQYRSTLTKWQNFCSTEINPWKPTIENILSFLVLLFKNGLGYVAINSARSALSTLLAPIEGYSIGTHPLVIRFVKGVGRLRPPKCRYNNTWDASAILKFFVSWDCNEQLNLMNLSMKLVALLALCSGQRVQTLSSIKLNEIVFNDTGVKIYISSQLKTSKPGVGTVLTFNVFSESKLCVVCCLRCYIERTKCLRSTQYLLMATRPKYDRASVQTVSNWLKKVLSLADIDVSHYKSHSFRHSSTSKALDLGVSTDVIYRAAGWSENSKVFSKFYCRPIVKEGQFSDAMLHSVSL